MKCAREGTSTWKEKSADVTARTKVILRFLEKFDRSVETPSKKLKEGKLSGLDGLATEHPKLERNACVKWLIGMFSVSLDARRVPIECGRACKVPLYKGNSSEQDCAWEENGYKLAIRGGENVYQRDKFLI